MCLNPGRSKVTPWFPVLLRGLLLFLLAAAVLVLRLVCAEGDNDKVSASKTDMGVLSERPPL